MGSLSSSVLWKRMVDYYDKMGPQVWADEVVPLDITSNKYIAQLYTKLIIAKIHDHRQNQAALSKEPFTIIEIGVGHGRFSFYLLKTLMEAIKTFNWPTETIRYVMTDISERNIEFWQSHPSLQPFIQEGVLDFALFNALEDPEIHLKLAKQTIKKGGLNQPMFAIANYLFDTLPHDAFRVEGGALYETELTIKTKGKDNKVVELKEYFEQAAFEFMHHKVSTDYYDDFPSLNKILSEYTADFKSASFLIPIGAFECIEHLRQFSKAPLTVLVADKGDANRTLFEGIEDPDISLHGSVSMTVNFDALSRFTKLNHGSAFLMDNKNAEFQVACLAFDVNYPISHLRFASQNALSSFTPQDLFNLCYSSEGDTINESLESLDELLALLNLAQWDPSIFFDFHEQILAWVEKNDITDEQDAGILNGLDKVWDYFFMLEKSRDIPFAIASILYQINEDEKAVHFYHKSLKYYGDQEETYFNMALAYDALNQKKEVKECLNKALALNPKYKDAKKMLKAL